MKAGFGRKLFSLGEFYRIYYLSLFSLSDFIKGRKNGLLSEEFIERIMLAVTEVNGCAFCSYAHTKMALEAGMPDREIQDMLKGIMDHVPEDEISGVLFAQHYADNRGKPSEESWNRIVEIYGNRKAEAILGTTRMIMFGNASGIPIGSLISRFKGKGDIDERSNLAYEIIMIIAIIIYLPLVVIHVIISKIISVSKIKFHNNMI